MKILILMLVTFNLLACPRPRQTERETNSRIEVLEIRQEGYEETSLIRIKSDLDNGERCFLKIIQFGNAFSNNVVTLAPVPCS